VKVKNITVVGGDNGIVVTRARRVVLDDVHVAGARMDGIHVRFSQVMIRNCSVDLSGRYTQGIDISYSGFQGMSSVEGCDVTGGGEGIVTHASMVMVAKNRVFGTSLRGITMSEMSMGEIEQNDVSGAVGVGVYCGDHSECEMDGNVVAGTRSAGTSDLGQAGIGIEAKYYALATLDRNVLVDDPRPVAAFSNSTFENG